MALNVDKNRQVAGYTTTPTAQQRAGQTAASDQPSIFSSGQKKEDALYTIQRGDTLWGVAKQLLITSGISNPTNGQIIEAMNKIAQANGCSSIEECSKKFFYTIGNKINLEGLFSSPQAEPVAEEAPAESGTPVLSEQETKIKEELKSKFPDLGLQNMNDSEVKAFLDKLKETNPELLSALEATVSSQGAEEVSSTEGVSEQAQTTGLTEEQTTVLQDQLNQYISEHPEAVTEHSTTPQSSVPKSEIEQLAEKIGIEGNIDEVIGDLRRKAKEDLTPDEARLLSLYDTARSSFDKEKMLATVNMLVRNDFMKLTPDQQMSMIVDQYLTKHDEEYVNLPTEAAKQEYLDKKIAELNELAQPDNIDTGLRAQFAENLTSIRTMVLLNIAETQGKSVEELKNDPDIKRQITEGENVMISGAFSLVKEQVADKLKGASGEERLNIYADAILNMVDSQYALMPEGAEKDQYRNGMIKKIAKTLISKDGNITTSDGKTISVDKLLENPQYRENIYLKLSYALDYVANGTDGDFVTRINEFNIESPVAENAMFMKAIEERINRGEELPEDKQNLIKCRNYDDMLSNFRKQNGSDAIPTNKQALETVESMIRNAKAGDAPDDVIQDLEAWKQELERINRYNPNGECRIRLSMTQQAEAEGKTVAQKLNEVFEGLDPHSEAFDNKIKRTIREKIGSVEDIRATIEYLKQQGYSDEQIESLINAEDALGADAYAHIIAQPPTAEDRAFLERLSASAKDQELSGVKRKVAADIYNPDSGFDYNESEMDMIAGAMSNDARLHPAIQEGVIAHSSSREQAADRFTNITNSDQLSDSGKATFNQTLISETLTSDEDRLFYGQYISEHTNSAAALEGIAAASNSISDTNMRNQYNSSVTTASQKYTPEQQNNINTAMQTGRISNETMSKTTPPASTSSSSTITTSSTQTGQSYSAGVSSASQPASSTAAAKTSAVLSQAEAQQIAASNAAKRQAAMDNAMETAQSIEEAVDNWNKRHTKKLTVDDIDAVKAAAAVEAAREAVESSATSESEKERILNALANATSVGEIYDILVGALGASKVQDKFIEILASSGSTSNIKAFVASRAGDSDSLVRRLFIRTSSSSLKKELLGMMSSDTVAELLANNQISDLTAVDQRILISYVMKNIHLMSNTEFARFLNAIADPVEKERLISIRTGVSSLKSRKQQAQKSQADETTVETAQTGDAPTVQPAPQAFSSMQQPASQTPVEPEEPVAQPQSKLRQGEVSRDMGDGTILTREGAGFGQVSTTDFDLTRIIQKPKHKDGAPIGMEDEILTVGSAEWNKKYNNNNVQTTAFTLRALDEEFEDDAFGGAWFGNKGNFKGKKIDKKGGLRFNA